MAVGVATSVAGIVGVVVENLREPGFLRWIIVTAAGSLITLVAGWLLVFYMSRTQLKFASGNGTDSRNDDQLLVQHARWGELIHRVGMAFRAAVGALVITVGIAFFGRLIVTGDDTVIWSWLPSFMAIAIALLPGGVLSVLHK
jgi:hypothetical protein